jgi:hypothetical protein
LVGALVADVPHHIFTPPCFEQAPCCVFAVENVASAHCAVAFFGAFAGFCANADAANAIAVAKVIVEKNRRVVIWTSRSR